MSRSNLARFGLLVSVVSGLAAPALAWAGTEARDRGTASQWLNQNTEDGPAARKTVRENADEVKTGQSSTVHPDQENQCSCC